MKKLFATFLTGILVFAFTFSACYDMTKIPEGTSVKFKGYSFGGETVSASGGILSVKSYEALQTVIEEEKANYKEKHSAWDPEEWDFLLLLRNYNEEFIEDSMLLLFNYHHPVVTKQSANIYKIILGDDGVLTWCITAGKTFGGKAYTAITPFILVAECGKTEFSSATYVRL